MTAITRISLLAIAIQTLFPCVRGRVPWPGALSGDFRLLAVHTTSVHIKAQNSHVGLAPAIHPSLGQHCHQPSPTPDATRSHSFWTHPNFGRRTDEIDLRSRILDEKENLHLCVQILRNMRQR